MVKLFKNTIIGLMAVCALLPGVTEAADEDGTKKAAITAAENWIALIDAGDYASSWHEASEVFQSAVNRDRWVHALPLIRGPLGRVMTRTIDTVSFIDDNPGLTEEQSAVVRFKTSFQNLHSATETVMLTPDKDGRWKIMGYYITSGFLDRHGLGVAILLLIVIIAAWYLELKPARNASEK